MGRHAQIPDVDGFLRQWGFEIWGRPPGGAVVWLDRKNRKTMIQDEALAIAQRRRQEKLAELECKGT
jgi:hypothetical protein